MPIIVFTISPSVGCICSCNFSPDSTAAGATMSKRSLPTGLPVTKTGSILRGSADCARDATVMHNANGRMPNARNDLDTRVLPETNDGIAARVGGG